MPGRKVRLFLSAYCIVEAQPGLQRNSFYILKRPDYNFFEAYWVRILYQRRRMVVVGVDTDGIFVDFFAGTLKTS